ncbi:MAG: alpha/beta hydrolase [Rikenellaceae bacterium]
MKLKNLLVVATLSLTTFASCAQELSKAKAEKEADRVYKEQLNEFVDSFADEWEDRVLTNGDYQMPFWYEINGEKPKNGYAMYISMHGGGGAPAQVNDKQWSNQKKLYGTVDGLYWVPRAPTDEWNLWHQGYMEDFLLKAVSYAVAKLGVDPNRIYLTGYSAGGDGTFNLAPRLADRFGAAAMMAGHPGDAVAENLRNLPFAIYMGGQDAAYNRNGLAAEWGVKLDKLEEQDPNGYIHRVVIYPENGHWMDNKDKEAIGWMAGFTRNPYPNKVIWIQDDVLAKRKYYLEVENPTVGKELVVSYNKASNTIVIEKSDYRKVTIWLNDVMMNLDQEVKVLYKGEEVFCEEVDRTIDNIEKSAEGRLDRAYIFPAKIEVEL